MSVKGNLARGRQKTLKSGENIKTVNGKDILGGGDLKIGKWKLLGETTVETASQLIYVTPTDGNFLLHYTKFRVLAEFELSDSSVNTLLPEIGFYKNNAEVANGKLFLPYSGASGLVAKAKNDDGTYLPGYTVAFDLEKVTDSVMTSVLYTMGSASNYAWPPQAFSATNQFIDLIPEGCGIYFRDYRKSNTYQIAPGSTIKLLGMEV